MIIVSKSISFVARAFPITALMLAGAGCLAGSDADEHEAPIATSSDALSVADWSSNVQLPMQSTYPPALTSLGGYIYMVHGGGDCGYCDTLYWSRWNGSSWSADTINANGKGCVLSD